MEPNPTAEAALWTGRQQAFAMIATKCSAAQAQCLREIRDAHAHDAFGLTWDEFCTKHAGISRSYADALIHRREEFGEAYFHLCELVRVSPETFRQIAGRVTEDTIELEGELVPLTPANAPKIRAGIKRLRDQIKGLQRQSRWAHISEHRFRLDEIISIVGARVSAANILSEDELLGLHDLARHCVGKWTRLFEQLDAARQARFTPAADTPSASDTDSAR